MAKHDHAQLVLVIAQQAHAPMQAVVLTPGYELAAAFIAAVFGGTGLVASVLRAKMPTRGEIAEAAIKEAAAHRARIETDLLSGAAAVGQWKEILERVQREAHANKLEAQTEREALHQELMWLRTRMTTLETELHAARAQLDAARIEVLQLLNSKQEVTARALSLEGAIDAAQRRAATYAHAATTLAAWLGTLAEVDLPPHVVDTIGLVAELTTAHQPREETRQ